MVSYHQTVRHQPFRSATQRCTDGIYDRSYAQVLTPSPSSGLTGTEGSSCATTPWEGDVKNDSSSGGSSLVSSASIGQRDSLAHDADSDDDEILRGSSEEEEDEVWSSADEQGFSMAPDTSDEEQGPSHDPTMESRIETIPVVGVTSGQVPAYTFANHPQLAEGGKDLDEDEDDEDEDDDALFARLMARTAQLRSNCSTENNAAALDNSAPTDETTRSLSAEGTAAPADQRMEQATRPCRQARRWAVGSNSDLTPGLRLSPISSQSPSTS